ILGFDDSDRVLELIQYPSAPRDPSVARDATVLEPGYSHVGINCDDIDATRAALEAEGVRFIVSGVAGIAGLRTTWFVDPWGVIFILMEKRHPDRPYWRQYG